MDQTRVKELFALLPPGAAYPAAPRCSPFRRAQFPPAERFAMAMRDPSFGAGFVGAFVEQRRWLPDIIIEWPLLQLFLSRVFKVTDPVILEVESFRTEVRCHDRDFLDALLLADDASLADIAGLLNTREQVIEAYQMLHWNVRDRLHETRYLAALLYPEGRQAAARDAKPDAVGDRLRLLRAGAENGKAEVLALAGLTPRREFDDSPGRFDRDLQLDASRRWQAGLRCDDLVIKAMHQTALRRKEIATNDDGFGLRNVSNFGDVTEDILKVAQRPLDPRPPLDLAQVMEDMKAQHRARHS